MEKEIIHLPGKINIENITTTRIENVINNSQYSKRSTTKKKSIRKNMEFFHIFHSIDYKKARKFFGPPNGTYHGEVFYKIWHLSFGNHEFLFFCDGPNTGMGSTLELISLSYEGLYKDKEAYDDCKEIQEKLVDIFKTF